MTPDPITFRGVSCAAIGSCVAVGGNGAELFVVTHADGAWARATPIAPPDGAPSATLNGVSCTAAGPCEAVGLSGTGTAAEAQLPGTYGGEAPSSEPAQTGSSTVKVVTVNSPAKGGGATPTCSLSLEGTAVQVTRTHVAQVKLADTGGACDGTVSLSIKAEGTRVRGKRKKPKVERIGSGSVALSPGATATVPVRLNGAGKAALAKAAGQLKAGLAVRAASAQISESVELHAGVTKHGKKPKTKRSRH